MASRAVESDKISSLLCAKFLYFVFILLIVKAKLKIWRTLQTNTNLSFTNNRPILYINFYLLAFLPANLLALAEDILFDKFWL
jgi:hypothetical protein